jgi:hypothetical protein
MQKVFLGKYTVVSQPASTTIIPLNTLKNRLNIPLVSTSKDKELTLLLDATVDQFMKFAQMGVLNTTMKCQLYSFSNFEYLNSYNSIETNFAIFRQKVHTINSVKYYVSGVLTTLANNKYTSKETPFYNEIITLEQNFPTNYDKLDLLGRSKPFAVEVEFVSGFGATSADVPPDVKQALISYVVYYYNNKGDCSDDMSNAQANQFINLISEHQYQYVL